MLVIFESYDEMIIGTLADRDRIISEYFNETSGRDLEDYDESVGSDCLIKPELRCRIYKSKQK